MRNLGKIIRVYLIVGSVYLVIDSLIHLFDLRLTDVASSWPQDALEYSSLVNHIYASFVLLTAALAFEMQRDLKKYRSLLSISGVWALVHGLILLYESSRIDLVRYFDTSPSLAFWLPFYNYYLWGESMILIGFFILTMMYKRSKYE